MVKIHHVVQIMPSIKLEETISTATTSQKLRVLLKSFFMADFLQSIPQEEQAK